MLKLATIPGVKDAQGIYIAPIQIDASQVTKGSDDEHVSITGLEPATTVETGQYYYGLYSEETNQFVSDLKPVPGFTVLGKPNVGDATVSATDSGANVTTDEG